MKAPLSWIKDYVTITSSVQKLSERLSEIGLGVEAVEKSENETIFDLEITPNRPDLLSIVGIAREVAAIEACLPAGRGKKAKVKEYSIGKPTKTLPFTVKNNFSLLEHYCSVVISNVEVKDSPAFVKKRLEQVGIRSINNVVDITNYVMTEFGIPLHAFDYDLIHGHEFTVEKSKGGEKFTSVDGVSYSLPPNAIIIRDKDRIVDLVGIKGGANTGINEKTKNVLLQCSVDNPILIRRASQSLALRSVASGILERGIDKNGLLQALSRAAGLMEELAGGKIASRVYDLKKEEFNPWIVELRLSRLKKILGIEIPEPKVIQILENLSLVPKKKSSDVLSVTIPTYRNDIQIEEDLIEEVARIYGYSNFPQKLPTESIPTHPISYAKPVEIEQKAREIMVGDGFNEMYTYSLVSDKDLLFAGFDEDKCLRTDNPVSREFEYLRPALKVNLLKAVKQNANLDKNINLFELGKVYMGKNLESFSEHYNLAAVSTNKNYFEIKGLLERLFKDLGIKANPTDYIEQLKQGVFFEMNFTEVAQQASIVRIFKPLPKYPPIVEDMAIIAEEKVSTGELMKEIKLQSPLISEVSLLDMFDGTRTFHIVYLHKDRNLTNVEVTQIREKILEALLKKFKATLKV